MNLADALHDWAERLPDKPALIEGAGDTARQISYADLARVVQSTALDLQRAGLGQSSRAVIMQPVGVDLYVVLLACFSLGVTAIIIDPAVRKEVIDFACAQTLADAFIGPWKAHLLRVKHRGFRGIKAAFHTSGVVPRSRRLRLYATDASCPPVVVATDHPALITFTSGSTGLPKVACRAHGFLQNQHRALSAALNLQQDDVDLVTLPVFGLANLASGMTSVIADTNLKYPAQADGVAIQSQCDLYQVTRCSASPAFFKKLHQDGRFPAFQTIYTGGAPVFPSFLSALTAAHPSLAVITVYGSTEAEPISHQDFRVLTTAQKEAQLSGAGLLVGRPVPEIKVRIEGDPVGEILVTGDHVLKGYLNAEKDTETKVIIEGKVWHRTGDLGRIDSEGNLWLLGRCSARFTTADGRVVYPFAIETAVMNILGIEACAVLLHRNEITLCYSGSPAPEKLKATAAELGIEACLPLPYIPLDPRHNAKVDYPALQRLIDTPRKG